MNRLVVLTLIVAVMSVGCKKNTSSESRKIATPSAPMVTLNYPSIPYEIVENIAAKADHLDVIFYNLPISMSRDGNPDVQQMLTHISDQVPTQVAKCPAIGRVFFQGEGKTLAEADIFLGEGCNYYLFYKDGKPAYANLLLPEGIKLYENITGPYRKK